MTIYYGVAESIQFISEIRVTVARLRQFLLLPEIRDNQLISNSLINLSQFNSLKSRYSSYTCNTCDKSVEITYPYIIINDATFSWDIIPNIKLKRVLTSKKNKSNDSKPSYVLIRDDVANRSAQ